MSKEVPFDKRNAAILHATGFSITDEPGHSESACVQGKMALLCRTTCRRPAAAFNRIAGGERNQR
jgi:hypothetical protein